MYSVHFNQIFMTSVYLPPEIIKEELYA